MRKFIWYLLNQIRIASIVQLVIKSGLKEDGWFISYYTKQAVDKDGKPIPWCTYPFIKFIEPRLNMNMHVFEYGCGNSTFWYAKRVKSVISVEHNRNWYDIVRVKLPENSSIIYKELEYGGAYSKAVFDEEKKYHIIVVDGRDRVNCAKNAVEALHENGVIIFDNTDRKQYIKGIDYLLALGFKRLDFHGLSPVTAHNNLTSIFYRENNCLDI